MWGWLEVEEVVLLVLWWRGGEVEVEAVEVRLLVAVGFVAVVLCGRWRGEWKGGGWGNVLRSV